jgi:hypothetical protein
MQLVKKYLGIIFFLASVVVGLGTYKTYGIGWDEEEQRVVGMTSYNYLVHGDTALNSYNSRTYGVAFELPLIVLEKVLRLHDSRDIYLMRHLVTHLFFLTSAFFFFLLIDHLYQNKLLAAIGFLLLILQPSIYGHSFFNSKDIPFLSMYVICFYLCAIAFSKNKRGYYILLGAACGILINLRIMGALMIACVGLLFLVDYIKSGRKKEVLISVLLFAATSLIVLYLSWPYLYTSPIHNLLYTFRTSSNHWHAVDLFHGTLIPGKDVSRSYIFIWFFMTNPIIYLFAGLFGLVLFGINFLKKPLSFFNEHLQRNNLIYAVTFLCPIIVVEVLHSTMYDSWRLLFFIYPAFILLAICRLSFLFNTRLKIPALAIILLGLGSTAYYMIKNFPHGHVYFNRFVANGEPEELRKNWELDYWGVSYKQAYEYILQHDASAKIDIAVANPPGEYNLLILKPEDRQRINLVEQNQNPQYFIADYRFHPQDYPYNPSQVVCNIKVLNNTIMSVFKLR